MFSILKSTRSVMDMKLSKNESNFDFLCVDYLFLYIMYSVHFLFRMVRKFTFHFKFFEPFGDTRHHFLKSSLKFIRLCRP